jgi:hypothetical protein
MAVIQDFRAISESIRTARPVDPVGFERTLMALTESRRKSVWSSLHFWVTRFAMVAVIGLAISIPYWPYFGGPNVLGSGQATNVSSVGTDSGAQFKSIPTEQTMLESVTPASAAGEGSKSGLPLIATISGANAGEPAKVADTVEGKTSNSDASPDANSANKPFVMSTAPLPPIGGNIVPFKVGPPAEDAPTDTGPKHQDLITAVRSLAKQYQAKVAGERSGKTGTGSPTRTFTLVVSRANSERLVRMLRSSVGAFGSVSDVDSPSSERSYATARSAASQVSTEDLKQKLADLEAKRAALLADFYEDAKPVKEVDGEIADIRAALEKATKPVDPPAPGGTGTITVIVTVNGS